MMKTSLNFTTGVSGLAAAHATAQGGEIGHFAPGVPNIRDLAMPEPAIKCLFSSFIKCRTLPL